MWVARDGLSEAVTRVAQGWAPAQLQEEGPIWMFSQHFGQFIAQVGVGASGGPPRNPHLRGFCIMTLRSPSERTGPFSTRRCTQWLDWEGKGPGGSLPPILM